MTTGYLDIRVADCRIYGDFANGVLQSGTIVKPNVTYNGRFNSNQLLDGENCEEIKENSIRRGIFKNGFLVKGIYRWGTEYLEGIFEYNKLLDGTHITNQAKYIGEFKHEKLLRGTTYFANEIHQGCFNEGRLYNGTITNTDNSFAAKIFYNGIDLKQCEVTCNSNLCISKLNRLQLELLCCKGLYCEEAFKFYQEYLVKYSAKKIVMLKEDAYKDRWVSYNAYIGYQQIIQNMSPYTLLNIPDSQPIESNIDIFNYTIYNSHD